MKSVESRKSKLDLTRELLKALSTCVRSRSLYPKGHEIIAHTTKKLAERFKSYLADADDWTIVLMGGEFIFEKVPLPKVSNLLYPLYRLLDRQKIQSITVGKKVSEVETERFLSLLDNDEIAERKSDQWPSVLTEAQIENIQIQGVSLQTKAEKISTRTDDARDIYSGIKKALADLIVSLFDESAHPSLAKIEALKDQLIENFRTDRYAIVSRLHTKRNTADLAAHSLNTAILSYLVGEALELDHQVLSDLFMAALFHDIGNVDVPPRYENGILYECTDSQIRQEHPLRSLGLLRSIPGMPALAEIAAFEHHGAQKSSSTQSDEEQKPSGSLIGELVGMVNHYEKLMHGANPMPPDRIADRLIRLYQTGKPAYILKVFLQTLGVFPPGTYVKLTTGQIGLVVKSNVEDVLRPKIRILFKEDGSESLDTGQVDLTKKDTHTGMYFASIQEAMDSSKVFPKTS